MKIDILTLFPDFFISPLDSSILKRAKNANSVDFNIINIRDYSTNKHKTVDDRPFGGGCGMVMQIEPIFKAINDIPKEYNPRIIFLCPTGKKYNQELALELSNEKHLVLLCGHYEGIDNRVRENLVTDEISIGDYVLTGGEIPALTLIDSVVRLLPGVLGNEDSAVQDSFTNNLLDCPHYSRPAVFNDWEVPEVLLSGNHKNIDEWRLKQKIKLTITRRPDLIDISKFDKKTIKIYKEVKQELNL